MIFYSISDRITLAIHPGEINGLGSLFFATRHDDYRAREASMAMESRI